MHSLGTVTQVERRPQGEVAGEGAAAGQLKLGAAGPGHSWTPLLTSGRPQRACACDQSGEDLERQHQKTDPTQSLEQDAEREREKRIIRGYFSQLRSFVI